MSMTGLNDVNSEKPLYYKMYTRDSCDTWLGTNTQYGGAARHDYGERRSYLHCVAIMENAHQDC